MSDLPPPRPVTPPPSFSRPTYPDGKVHGVVVGCTRPDGRWLLIRRSAHVAAPLKVCFPGGGIEFHESEEVAAVREIREELGVEVRLRKRVWTWDSPTRPLLLAGWYAELLAFDVSPNPYEVAEALWLTSHEAATHPDRLIGTEFFVDALLQAARPT